MTEKDLKAFDEYDYPFLDEPIPVTEQNWPKDVPPLVSVSCKTFMHENFIRDAIEGFLMQKTTFRVELLIHDDASTDKTADIVREYEKKHPQLIRATYQVENQYKKKPKTDKYVKPHPRRGKYVAPCEGDDYWTDPMKLQKQVEFMEGNPGYSLCYHSSRFLKDNQLSDIKPKHPKDYTQIELSAGVTIIRTCTKMFRRMNLLERPRMFGGDGGLNAYLGFYGECKFLESIEPSVYRVHSGGVYSGQPSIKKTFGPIVRNSLFLNYYIDNNHKEFAKHNVRWLKTKYLKIPLRHKIGLVYYKTAFSSSFLLVFVLIKHLFFKLGVVLPTPSFLQRKK